MPKSRRPGLESHVRFVGHVEDVAAAFQAAHVAVVASTEPEAFGRAAIEAAAMGCPVIATAIGAPPETVLAEPASAGRSGHRLAGSPGRRRGAGRAAGQGLWRWPWAERAAIGDRARAHVLAQFTVEAMQRRTLAVYDRLLGSSLERGFIEAPAPPACRGCPLSAPRDNLDFALLSLRFLVLR